MSEERDPPAEASSWPSVPATLDALPSAAAVTSGSRVLVNRRFLDLYDGGSSAAEMDRRDYEALLLERTVPADRERLASLFRRLGEDPRASASLTLRHPGNRARTITLSTEPVEDREHRVVGRLTLHRLAGETEGDAGLPELETLRDALLRSDKMASLGQLLVGVAHEIKTPIGSLSSNASLLTKAVERLRGLLASHPGASGSSEVSETLELIDGIAKVNVTASERIVHLVRSLKTFARRDESERRKVDLHLALESSLALVRHELDDRVNVVRDYGELPEVSCSPGQMDQVFLNLLVNAAQAIEARGEIRIRTRVLNDSVEVEIEDTGPGIRAEHLGRIFEPGFTTKAAGVGTGLGLPICCKILAEHGGNLAVRSTPGHGTSFTVTLPVAASSVPDPARPGDCASGDSGAPSASKER